MTTQNQNKDYVDTNIDVIVVVVATNMLVKQTIGYSKKHTSTRLWDIIRQVHISKFWVITWKTLINFLLESA